MTDALPIVEVLPQIAAALQSGRSLVIQAPPGAGKSTRVPLELLEQPWARGRRILMLEPRRLAARAVAARMAFLLGEPVGRTVGYRMRLDTRVSDATRLEVLTEGVLSGLLRDDPALEDVACVIFDEFHERSLQADLGLAMCLDARQHLNESLRIVVMSATLEADPVARLLDDATTIVRSAGRSHPVDVRYAARVADPSLEPRVIAERCAQAVRRALGETSGDLLVFLPGAGEIRRVQGLLGEAGLDSDVMLAPLFGDLSRDEQDRAIAPAPPGRRKVVLATNIAETSLTIEGVRVVVDAGVARRARFDPVTGMSRLETLRISRASADQRCGRAGRVAAGTCYRLWTEATQRALEAQTPAEILEADLAPLALEIAGWNVTDASALRWLDLPPSGSLAQARDLLRQLGALDREQRITPHGRALLGLRTHPRLAHMLLRARDIGLSALAADIAAVLTERFETNAAIRDADLRKRLDALQDGRGVDKGTRDRAKRTADLFLRQLGERGARREAGDDAPGTLVALAYPDRIARQKGSGRYVLSNGRGAVFTAPQSLARAEFLAIAELDAGAREALIRLAAPLSRGALEDAFADQIEVVDDIRWEPRERAVMATRTRRLGDLVIDEKPLRSPGADKVATAFLQGIRDTSLDALPWTRDLRAWQARVAFVRRLPAESAAGWPDVSDQGLAAQLDSWLAPWIHGMSRIDHLARLDLRAALESLLDWRLRERLDALAPASVQVPSGSHIRIDYLDPETPSLSVRLQEVFGLRSTPRIGGGAVAVVMKLLSPAQRPVQVTRDLESFWRSGYAEVRKELKGRYPKHYWPDDPLQAEPRRGTRRR